MDFDGIEFEDVGFGPALREDGDLIVSVGKSIAKSGDKLNMSVMIKTGFAEKHGYVRDMPIGFQIAELEDGFMFRLPKIEASHAKLRLWGSAKEKFRLMFSNIKDPGIKKGRYVFNDVQTAGEAIVFKLEKKADVSGYIRKQIVESYQGDGADIEELSENFGLDVEIIKEVLIEEKILT